MKDALSVVQNPNAPGPEVIFLLNDLYLNGAKGRLQPAQADDRVHGIRPRGVVRHCGICECPATVGGYRTWKRARS